MIKAAEYMQEVLKDKNAPVYVKKQVKEIKKIYDGKDAEFVINYKAWEGISGILKILIMPSGTKKGKTVFESLSGYQAFMIFSVFCVVYKNNTAKRRYNTVVLEIGRKNGKTFIVAVILIICLLTLPRFAEIYSVAPDGTLSREVKKAINNIIASSPALNGTIKGRLKFKILRDYIKCFKDTTFYPLNFSTNRMDGREPSVFIADEVGALPIVYPIEAMQSGQILLNNPLGFIISTKYPTTYNPFEGIISAAKKELDGLTDSKDTFALLFEPNENIKKQWATNDNVLLQANPLAAEYPEILKNLKEKREKAVNDPQKVENFLCKHCNIIYAGAGLEVYIAVDDFKKCRVKSIDWSGRKIYMGLDLALTTDNCAVAIAAYDEYEDKILIDVMPFIPEERIDEKSKTEKINYREFINAGQCIACGESVVDYKVIEEYALSTNDRTGGELQMFGYDVYNATSSAQKLEAAGFEGVIIRQHSSVLHAPTKLFREYVLNKKVEYAENKLFEINVENAKATRDTNLNMYLNKKKSSGKIDLLAATINAVYLLQQNEILKDSTSEWGAIC